MLTKARQEALIALRARDWTPFGITESSKLSKRSIVEAPQIMALGDVDPVIKNALAFVSSLMAEEARREPELTDPRLKRVHKELKEEQERLRKEDEERKRNEEEARAAATAAGSGGAGSSRTWASKMNENKGAKQGPSETKFVIDQATGKRVEVDPRKIRVMGVSTVSNLELNRLFGPENKLARILKVTRPRDDNGDYRDFAYVWYEHSADGEKARERMNNRKFKNVKLGIDFCLVDMGGPRK